MMYKETGITFRHARFYVQYSLRNVFYYLFLNPLFTAWYYFKYGFL